MPRISLCLIARDEQEMLPGCLESVNGTVDDIVLVDTGSRDRTRELAAAAGARVFDLPWKDDFAAPRNESLRHARGDWLLILDADERLAPGAGKALLRAVRKARFDVGMLPLHNASALDASPEDVLAGRARIGNAMSLPRLLRRAARPEYHGIVHESVEEWFLRGGHDAVFVDAPIVHLGAVEALRRARGKNERNVALLRRRCELVPGDVTALGYLATELLAAGDVDGASSVVEAAWAAAEAQPTWRSVRRVAAVRARLAVERGDPETALSTIIAAERRQGPSFDLAFWRGRAWDAVSHEESTETARAAAADRAAAAYEQAHALQRVPAAEKLTHASAADVQIRRGHALLGAGRVRDARAEFEEVFRQRPGDPLARMGLAEGRLDDGAPLDAIRILEPVLATGVAGPDAWVLAAAAAEALGAEADAALFLARARQNLAAGFAAPHRELRFRTLTNVCRSTSNDR